jgi:hypothetical protein
MVEHHNACLNLAFTPWALVLHEDDELRPNIVAKLDSFLATCNDGGLVLGGTEFINKRGS